MLARILLIAAVAGCGSKSDSSGSGSAEPRVSISVGDPIGFCGRARAVMLGRRKCFPEDTSLKMGLEEIAGLEAGAPAEPVARRAVAAKCAVILDGMIRAEQPANCPLDVTDSEDAELVKFLGAWNADKKKPPGGSASGSATAPR